jgi:hypothetical protein
MDDPKTLAPGSAETQLRNDFLSFWSGKTELELCGPMAVKSLYFNGLWDLGLCGSKLYGAVVRLSVNVVALFEAAL